MESNGNVLEGARVLCVDDNQDNLDLLTAVLESRGACVTACSSAGRAIVTLTNERFDAVVSDISMPPGLDGYDLAHALRGMEVEDPSRPATPMVAVSGEALLPSRKRRFGDFQVYIRKPFDSVRLIHIIERLVAAEGEAVKVGSLGIWEADQATEAAEVATAVASTAAAAAVEATSAAGEATTAATKGKLVALAAEASAAAACAKAPLPLG